MAENIRDPRPTRGQVIEERFETTLGNPLKFHMRRALVILWFLAVGWSQAGAPLDLDSPFPKTALIQDKNGKREEREIQSAKPTGDKLELFYPQGGVGLFPRIEIVAIIPRLPKPGQDASLDEIDQAIRFLEALPEDLRNRPEASAETLQRWRDLRKPAEEALQRKQQEEAQIRAKKQTEGQARVKAWLAEVADLQKARDEQELAELKRAGELFLKEKIGEESKVRDGLFMISQVSSKEKRDPLPELSKLEDIQPALVPDDLLIWVSAGILLLSLFGLMAGTSFTSNGLSRFREGALLGGILFGGAGVAILGGLLMVWWPAEPAGTALAPDLSPKMQQAVLFAKNRVKPAYFLPETEFEVSAHDFVTGMMAAIPPSSERAGIFKGKLKEGKLFVQGQRWAWRQPVTVLALPFPLVFTFSGKTPSFESWSELAVDRVELGRILLPDFLGISLGEGFVSSVRSGLNAGGFERIKLLEGPHQSLTVQVPASGTRPKIVKQEEKKKEGAYRREISAEDLGKVFVSGQGGEFVGKFIVVNGVVEKISSGSEYSKSALDEKTKDETSTPKITSDQFDVFYLKAADRHGFRNDPLYIRCVIKSPSVFSMDGRGDVYTGTVANQVNDKPFLKKGKRVKFLKEGRVENAEIKNNEIEVYGIEIDGGQDIEIIDPNASPQP